jgi:hypothetical protein
MATSLDVPLDDLIKSRNGRGWGRSRGQGGAREVMAKGWLVVHGVGMVLVPFVEGD